MAACTKVAAFGALMRVLYVGFSGVAWDWRPIIWAVAIASMIVGAVLGVTQTDIKRVLAYSSIAHAGFILVGLVAVTKDSAASVLFYVVTYGFTTLAAFGLLMLVRDADGEATHLSQWSGLARKSPLVATVMTILLLSMTGIPLTSGFTGKFFVFRAAWHTAGPLVVIALLCSAVAAFYYLRIVVLMFFAEPPENAPDHCDSRLVGHGGAHLRRRHHRRARRLPAVADRPRGQSRGPARLETVAAVNTTLLGLAFADAEFERAVRSGLDAVEQALRVAVHSDDDFVAECRAASGRRPAASGSVRCVCLLAGQFGDPTRPEIVPAAVVVELTHLATLYHDDVMDEALVRRGAVSANSRYGNSVAILTGDFLFSRASNLLADLGPHAVRLQARTFERLVTGQIRETVGPAGGADRIEHYLAVLADKTGSLIATSAEFGAHVRRRRPGHHRSAARVRRADRRGVPAQRRHPRHRVRIGGIR